MGRESAKDKITGKIKEVVGKAGGNERMASEGRADQVKGKAKGAMEEAKEGLQGIKDSLKRKGEK